MTVNRREFLQKAGLGALQLGLMSYLPASSLAEVVKSVLFPRSAPELQGVDAGSILGFVKKVEERKLNLHSLMIVRRGHVVGEGWWAPYGPELKHTLYSLSKSFTSSAIGLAVSEGKLKVEDKVVSFFPDEVPETISKNLAAMRVKDLLTMSTGHDKDSTPFLREGNNKNWIKAFLAVPVEHEPGTFFVYNSGATYMLSAIVEKVTGQKLIDYLKPRLFVPLGIEGADWEVDPNGINTGGWGLRVRTEDIARFGQMYLQKGKWNGKQILPESWITEATTSHIQSKGGSRKKEENDWLQGYGYQFWRCRHNAFRGDGAYGQYCIVVPEQEAVIAITSETSDMQAILDEVWNELLPGMKGGKLPVNPNADQQLKQKLGELTLPLVDGKPTSQKATAISGKQFAITHNELGVKAISLKFEKNCIVTILDAKGRHQVAVGLGSWKSGVTDLSTMPLKLVLTPVPGETQTRIAACGGWTSDSDFEMIWRFTETAHYDTIKCSFDGSGIAVEFKRSLAILGNAKDPRPVLTGTLQA